MVVLQEQCAMGNEGWVTEKQLASLQAQESSRILDFSLSEQFSQRSLRTERLDLKARSANEPFYVITVFTSDTSYKMLHHIRQQALFWSVSSPEMKGKETWCDPHCHRQPYCKMDSGYQACIVILQNYLRDCEDLLRQKDNSSDLDKLWEQGWRESTVGQSEYNPGLHNCFSSQEYWSLSEPLCGWYATAKVK